MIVRPSLRWVPRVTKHPVYIIIIVQSAFRRLYVKETFIFLFCWNWSLSLPAEEDQGSVNYTLSSNRRFECFVWTLTEKLVRSWIIVSSVRYTILRWSFVKWHLSTYFSVRVMVERVRCVLPISDYLDPMFGIIDSKMLGNLALTRWLPLKILVSNCTCAVRFIHS